MVKFSDDIFKTLHSDKPKVNKDSKYKEALAPKIAKYIEINDETLRRSESLSNLGSQLGKCANLKLSKCAHLINK